MNKPKLDDYCNVLYDGRKCVAKVIDVTESTFDVITTFNEKMYDIPIEKFNKNETYAFEKVSRPLIEYLCKNHHPHVYVIVTPTGAELLEGIKSTGNIMDYISD